MPARSGRLEKRLPIVVPIEISSVLNPWLTERTTTENVSSLGVRVLTQKAKVQNERLMITSLAGDLQVEARVVYCVRIPDGRFGVGIQFQAGSYNWSRHQLADTAT